MAFPFDMSTLQQALNDPAIKQMADQIANNPAFREMAMQMQENFAGMINPNAAASDPLNAFDPSKYMNVMKDMFQNPEIMSMAEQLGRTLIEGDPQMSQMVKSMQDPEYKKNIEEAMKTLKEDPKLKPIFEEVEKSGPMGMMKYWNDPEILAKFSQAMGGMIPFPDGEAAGENGEPAEAEEAEEEPTVHSAASSGNFEQLKQLLEGGADPNEKDEEGRTALHFASGYGEQQCAEILLEHKANIDAVDNNSNSALHYAAGYGQPELVKMLIAKGADRSLKNMDGKTALEVAELNEQEDVIAALK